MNRILIVDFGSQYTHLITKCLNYKLSVETCIIPYTQIKSVLEKQTTFPFRGVILSGGPKNANDINEEDQKHLEEFISTLILGEVPILGICFGFQWIAKYFGATVEESPIGEFGDAILNLTNDQTLFPKKYCGDLQKVWMSHQDQVTKILNEEVLKVTGSTATCKIAMFECQSLNVYGCQFHPEVDHTTDGLEIYRNFTIDICKCKPQIEDSLNSKLLQTINDETNSQLLNGNDQGGTILVAVSGGVDSTILSYILNEKYSERVVCVFINNGLMRKGEVKEITERFAPFGERFICVNAKNEFLTALTGVSDPEVKRKIIGKQFIDVFQAHVKNDKRLHNVEWLAQGTIYPDVIESCGINKTSKTIKSHHNLSLPDTLHLKILEPLKYLFKDQVRDIGTSLKLEHDVIHRHPFPGPGLGIRILGEVKKEYIKILKKADKIFIDSLREHNLYYSTSQAYAALFPVKTVGVVGDNRRYGWTIVLRAITSGDFMTATVSDLPLSFLTKVSTHIVNECSEVGRVLFDITSKPPATVEME